jgi:hypothetical protein
MDDDLTDEERSAQVRSALFKALGVLAVIGVLIFLGTTIMVHALGLNDGSSPGPVGSGSDGPTQALPSTALPVPDEESDEPSDEPSAEPSPSDSASASPGAGKLGDLELNVSPIRASPQERINFTGTYKGADNLQLEIQRFDSGKWSNFGVQATVHVGTFATYIKTGRTGENRFRVFDPQTKEGSNVILVTIA